MRKNQRGFTLVELSIVLVIIGLLVGGVLTGQTLIRAAELRSVTAQEQRYIAAVQTFRDKYFALPGDMTNATAYWGAADGSTGTTAACATTASTTAVTCNGNGDGLINIPTGSNEIFRFWQHLANAGLIEGNYNGIPTAATTYGTTTANAPSGRISSSLWWAYYRGPQSGNPNLFDGQYDNTFEFGGMISTQEPNARLFKPEEIHNIDTKLDDGKPATGKIVMLGVFSACTDASASTTLTANYLLTNTAQTCALIFRQAF